MSQTFTDNCYQSDHVGQTDLANMEANFASLKSSFSGTSAPSNTVAGMFWLDTTNHILKMRNEANSAWVDLIDISTGYTYALDVDIIAGTGMSGGGTLTSDRTLNHAAHTGDVTGAAALTLADGVVSQAKLKTTTSISSINGTTAWQTVSLTGAEYGFIPMITISNSSDNARFRWHDYSVGYYERGNTSYQMQADFKTDNSGSTAYMRMRYINSSGEIYWAFGLVDKDTQKPCVWNVGENHPCFGNGQDPVGLPQPFINYDKKKYELFVANPPSTQLSDLRRLAAAADQSLNEFIIDSCRFDLSRSASWPTEMVSVGLAPDWEEKPIGDFVESKKMVIPRLEGVNVAPLILN